MFACCWGNGQLCTLIAALLYYYVMPSHEYVVFTCMLPLWDGDGRRSLRYQTVRYVCMHPWAIMPVFLLTTKCLLLHLLPKCRYVIFFADWCDPHEKWKQSRIFVWEGQMVDLTCQSVRGTTTKDRGYKSTNQTISGRGHPEHEVKIHYWLSYS